MHGGADATKLVLISSWGKGGFLQLQILGRKPLGQYKFGNRVLRNNLG
jgi:hypothetical protein